VDYRWGCSAAIAYSTAARCGCCARRRSAAPGTFGILRAPCELREFAREWRPVWQPWVRRRRPAGCSCSTRGALPPARRSSVVVVVGFSSLETGSLAVSKRDRDSSTYERQEPFGVHDW